MIFAGIYKNELSVINVFPSIQCFCLNISEMNRIESTSYSVLITRGISRYVSPDQLGISYIRPLVCLEVNEYKYHSSVVSGASICRQQGPCCTYA